MTTTPRAWTGGIVQETNRFSPIPTAYEDFEDWGGAHPSWGTGALAALGAGQGCVVLNGRNCGGDHNACHHDQASCGPATLQLSC